MNKQDAVLPRIVAVLSFPFLNCLLVLGLVLLAHAKPSTLSIRDLCLLGVGSSSALLLTSIRVLYSRHGAYEEMLFWSMITASSVFAVIFTLLGAR